MLNSRGKEQTGVQPQSLETLPGMLANSGGAIPVLFLVAAPQAF